METKIINSPPIPARQLQGFWLLFARTIWIILTTISIGILLAAMIGLYVDWQKPCNSPTYSPDTVANCFSTDQALHQLGLSQNFYAVYFPAGVMFEVLPWILIGILVFSRKSREPFGLLFSLMLVVSGTVAFDDGILSIIWSDHPNLSPLLNFMGCLGGMLLVAWYLFPDGRFVPKWIRWMAILWVIRTFFIIYFPDSPFNTDNWLYPLAVGVIVLFAASIVYSLVYRYRHIPDQAQRQQIKWVAVSVSFFALIYVIGMFLPVQTGVSEVIINLTYLPLRYLSTMLVGVSLGFTILRYRLWDIDFFINRTLVYGAVTAILALLWLITLGLLQLLFQQFSNGSSEWLPVVLSSFEAAALFNPVRERVEKWINLRFYKDRVDFNEAFVELQSDKWQFISSKDMFQLLVTKTPYFLKSIRSAIYQLDNDGVHLVSTFGINSKEASQFKIDEKALTILMKGKVVTLNEKNFVLLVPLSVPRQHMNDLVGILALGPRLEGWGYSRDHVTDLANLGERAGTALHFLQLNEHK